MAGLSEFAKLSQQPECPEMAGLSECSVAATDRRGNSRGHPPEAGELTAVA